MMPINVVDLFSGAGGLTCGFSYKIEKNSFKKTHDFNFIFANEYNEQAAKAFATNFSDIQIDIKDFQYFRKKNRTFYCV